MLTLRLSQGPGQILALRLERLRQPLPGSRAVQGLGDEGRFGQEPRQVLPDQPLQARRRGEARLAAAAGPGPVDLRDPFITADVVAIAAALARETGQAGPGELGVRRPPLSLDAPLATVYTWATRFSEWS